MNIGHSSRLGYDKCYYSDRLSESTAPLQYKINGNYIENCNKCLSTLGPRSSYMGHGVSTAVGHPQATSQALADVESILKNLNVKTTKCKRGNVNPVRPKDFKNTHSTECNNFLDPMSSRLTYPARTFRDMATNRFHDLPIDPQANIFYDFAVNTRLESTDNFVPHFPTPNDQYSGPVARTGPKPACNIGCPK